MDIDEIIRTVTTIRSPSFYVIAALPFALILASIYAYIFSPSALLAPLISSSKRTSKPKSSISILLVGPLASGKTAAFSDLVYGYAPQTHTSMKENEAVIKSKFTPLAFPEESEKEKLASLELTSTPLKKPLHLVDIPGHSRLRTRSLAQFLPAADGIVFTIDAAVGLSGKNIRDAGEHLHLLLSLSSLISSTTSSPPLPILILLTKTDLLPNLSSNPKALSLLLDRAKSSLSRELDRRRLATQSTSAGAKLEGLDSIPSTAGGGSSLANFFGGGSGSAGVGTEGGLPTDEGEVLGNEAFAFEGAFEWNKLENEVKWGVANVKSEKGEGMQDVWEWVDGIMR